MVLNTLGKIVEYYCRRIPHHFKHVELDEFVIMPNHIHGIIIINDNRAGDDVRAVNNKPGRNDNRRGVRSNAPTNPNVTINPQNYFSQISPHSGTLGVIIRSYKSSVSRWCRKNKNEHFKWQRNYHEHIIRNDKELYEIRKYIMNNPLKWELDNEHPDNPKNPMTNN